MNIYPVMAIASDCALDYTFERINGTYSRRHFTRQAAIKLGIGMLCISSSGVIFWFFMSILIAGATHRLKPSFLRRLHG